MGALQQIEWHPIKLLGGSGLSYPSDLRRTHSLNSGKGLNPEDGIQVRDFSYGRRNLFLGT